MTISVSVQAFLLTCPHWWHYFCRYGSDLRPVSESTGADHTEGRMHRQCPTCLADEPPPARHRGGPLPKAHFFRLGGKSGFPTGGYLSVDNSTNQVGLGVLHGVIEQPVIMQGAVLPKASVVEGEVAVGIKAGRDT